ncbi:N-6 DNA methylase [Clostridium tyrobutyricum]|uniref:N-6 DNA methylase n=1 Tax=Clostridium tyrobutyricum TaxID=1519 RepID=UPI00073D3EC4|nr:N-6 DNA methylase [Clostridium tyrobutyricum]
MNYLNRKYEMLINSCFDELKGTFNMEEIFHIILVVSTISWINKNKRYNMSDLKFEKFTEKYNNTLYMLQDELKRFEYEFPEFEDILMGIMNKVFIYKDRAAEKKIQKVFYIIKGANFDSKDEIRKFINKLVSFGIVQCGFSETPEGIKKIIKGLIDFDKVRGFADYCSGTSSVAVEIFDSLGSSEISQDIFYYGEEINTSIYLISKLLMIINGISKYEIANKDVLQYSGNYRDAKFDFVFSDVPQVVYFDREFIINDPRLNYGIPTKSSADWAFAQNIIYHLNSNGKGILIGTIGTLVRGSETKIRKGILNKDLIECVITLPDNLYENTNIGTEMIIFNKNKSKDRIERVLFINASNYSYRLNRNQHTISIEGINKILECYRDGIEEDGFSKFVHLEKITEFNYTLNPKEYLDFDTLKSLFKESVPLKDIAQIIKGVQVSKEDLEKLSKQPEYYFLNVKNIENGKINYDKNSMLTYKKGDWIGKYNIRPNDIVITSKGSLVKIAIVEDDFRPAFISANLTIIRVNSQKYDAYILYEFLQSNIGRQMIEGIQTGTTIKLLNNAQLGRLELPVYEIEFMKQVGYDIKRSKMEYERRIEEAKRRFEEEREELLGKLGWHS